MTVPDDVNTAPDPPRLAVGRGADCYLENGCVVFTAAYHLNRGSCCGSGCRHCPYEPRHATGSTTVAQHGGQA